MARSILYEGNLSLVALAVSTWLKFIKDGAKCMHHIEVGFFIPATDVVGFTQFARLKHTANSTAVVFNVEPVADLLTITIDRERFAVQCIEDAERNELFREVIRPVVVRAIGG